METVVVFGATSYVGGFVVGKLLEAGRRVIGVTRRPALARILLAGDSDRLVVADPAEAAGLVAGEAVSVINLAYVKSAAPQLVYRQNRQLMKSIEDVVGGRAKTLVHVSTQSVFGDVFTEPPTATRLPWRAMDSLYAESKLHSEHLAERLAKTLDCELAIVRLGSVIGPGAPMWVGDLAQRILEVKPVGYTGEAGFSNATHVENVADYLVDLVDRPGDVLRRFGAYHHLAEFSRHRWPELLDVMSEEIGCAWTTVPRPGAAHKDRPVRKLLKAAYTGPAGAYVRAGLGRLPAWDPLERAIAGTREPPVPAMATNPVDGSGDDGLLDLLSSRYEFRSATVGEWAPGLDFGAACAGIAEWLGASGYRLADSGIR
jgi:nucleoside-diphosphate-sugar epimerase